MKNKPPFPLFNRYISLRYRIYRTIWPPRLRRVIGDTILIIAIRIMRRKRHFFDRNGVTHNTGLAYAYITSGISWYWKGGHPIPWIALLIAVKILMIRNLSRTVIVYRAGLFYDRLSEETNHDETPPP